MHKYDKIELNNSSWDLKYKKIKKWYVTEKVHGSNLSFIISTTDVVNIVCAKRTGVITGEFFNYNIVLERIRNKLLLIHSDISNKYNTNVIVIYGELFGGIYPTLESKFIPVQSGIYYSNDIHFMAFDIYLPEFNRYVDYDVSMQYFNMHDLLYAKPIAEYKSYQKAIEHNPKFETTIPNILGHPNNLEQSNIKSNYAEGIVIRSNVEHYLTKIKIKEFEETIDSDKSYNLLSKTDREKIALNMITTNRLDNAISKVGPLVDHRYEIYDLILEEIIQETNLTDKLEKKKILTSIKNTYATM